MKIRGVLKPYPGNKGGNMNFSAPMRGTIVSKI